jgi:hypothetical protein
VLYFLTVNDVLLVQDLHGVDPAGILLANLEHLAEASLADNSEQIKIF